MKKVVDTYNLEYNEVIQSAVDKAYPIFKLFGWTYSGEMSREEIEGTIVYVVNRLLEDDEIDNCSTGRFTARKIDDGEMQSIEIHLDLGSLDVTEVRNG